MFALAGSSWRILPTAELCGLAAPVRSRRTMRLRCALQLQQGVVLVHKRQQQGVALLQQCCRSRGDAQESTSSWG
jgi:hypothetical protein